MLRPFIFFIGIVFFSNISFADTMETASSNDLPLVEAKALPHVKADVQPSPAAKFFPINPAAHMRPVVRSTYSFNSVPVKPKRAVSSQTPMDPDRAEQLLSIYPVQN